MWSTIFIIDPLYSVPLFFGVIAALAVSRQKFWGHRANTVCLIVSTGYLLWTVGAKVYVTRLAEASLKRQDVSYEEMLTIPSPFNTLLWRVLAVDDAGYYEGFYSLFDNTKDVRVKHYPSDDTLLEGMADHWPVKRLRWFTHGFYSVKKPSDDVVITDLRMGMEPFYVFQFSVGEAGNPHGKPKRVSRGVDRRDLDSLVWVWHRIWTEKPRPLVGEVHYLLSG
jgi:inner membrane protein